MNKARVNYWIDVSLIITFFLSFITGIIKWPKLSSYFMRAGWPMFEISFIHDWSGIIMSLLVLVHIVLHWKWIVTMTKNIFGEKKVKQ